jgi:hypothetical protein
VVNLAEEAEGSASCDRANKSSLGLAIEVQFNWNLTDRCESRFFFFFFTYIRSMAFTHWHNNNAHIM